MNAPATVQRIWGILVFLGQCVRFVVWCLLELISFGLTAVLLLLVFGLPLFAVIVWIKNDFRLASVIGGPLILILYYGFISACFSALNSVWDSISSFGQSVSAVLRNLRD